MRVLLYYIRVYEEGWEIEKVILSVFDKYP